LLHLSGSMRKNIEGILPQTWLSLTCKIALSKYGGAYATSDTKWVRLFAD
jgi:hypothetical protein